MKKRRKVLNRNEENHVVFQLRLKTDLTEEVEILESFVIDQYVNRCNHNFIYYLYSQ